MDAKIATIRLPARGHACPRRFVGLAHRAPCRFIAKGSDPVTANSEALSSVSDDATPLLAEVEALGARLALRSEEHTSELQSHSDLVCRLLLEKKKKIEYSIPVHLPY